MKDKFQAILGGNCVDNGAYLGKPITELIDTFISVGGANYGSFLCDLMEPIGTCNKLNGLRCGSKYLRDINLRYGLTVNFCCLPFFRLFCWRWNKILLPWSVGLKAIKISNKVCLQDDDPVLCSDTVKACLA